MRFWACGYFLLMNKKVQYNQMRELMKANSSLNESLFLKKRRPTCPDIHRLIREPYPDDTANGMCKNG